MSRNLFLVLLAFLQSTQLLYSQKADNIDLIPTPSNVILGESSLSFASLRIQVSPETKATSDYFIDEVERYKLSKIKRKKGTPIHFKLENIKSNEDEGYSLLIDKSGITLSAQNKKGLFYASQTLLQLMRKNESSSHLPFCRINDHPRFHWRGLMIDEARHFLGKEKIFQILDQMAYAKLNKFHWHLTDAPAWRIEIKKYPKLTTIGAAGNHSETHTKAEFYSQTEIKEIVAYAAKRHIEIIPEIDMPGHASAAILAYPEHNGGGTEKHPNFTFNPGKDETYVFLENILSEIAELFPSKYIHIGGDEVSFGNEKWEELPEVKQLMKTEELANLLDVEHYFIRRIEKHVNSLGKTMLGWDELATSGVSKDNVVLMWWRHDKPDVLRKILDENYPLILCPRVPLYFDFKQDIKHKNGRSWNGAFADLKGVYDFPESLDLPSIPSQIKGIQANLWTERYTSSESIDFMLYPRMAALSESAWSSEKNKNFDEFEKKLKTQLDLYTKDKLYYYNPFQPDFHPEPQGANGENWQKRHLN